MVLELTVFILSFNFCCWLARSCRENLSKPKAQLWTSSSWMKRRRHWIDHESAVEEIEDFLALTTRISFTLFLPRFSRSQLIFFFFAHTQFCESVAICGIYLTCNDLKMTVCGLSLHQGNTARGDAIPLARPICLKDYSTRSTYKTVIKVFKETKIMDFFLKGWILQAFLSCWTTTCFWRCRRIQFWYGVHFFLVSFVDRFVVIQSPRHVCSLG